MDNLTIFDTFVHEKRVFSHNFNYTKHLGNTYYTSCIAHVSLLTLAFLFLS